MAEHNQKPKKILNLHGHVVRVFVSDKPEKKYYALVDESKTRQYFGATSFDQYKDLVGVYKHKNHGDKKRRDAYYSRHAADSKYDPKKGITPGVLSAELLWPRRD